MSEKHNNGKITYSKETIKSFNCYALRTIPAPSQSHDRYEKLRQLVNQSLQSNLSSVIKRPLIPAYLKDKYGEEQFIKNSISRGTFKDQRNLTRKRIFTEKTDSKIDLVCNKVRDILSKLSQATKPQLFKEFMNIDITDDCSDLVSYFYEYAIDCVYIITVYVELMLLLKQKNQKIYDQLIELIKNYAIKYPVFTESEAGKTKRWRIANCHLMIEVYHQNKDDIDLKQIAQVIETLGQALDASQSETLEVICEFLKKILPHLLKDSNHSRLVDTLIAQFESISHNQSYDLKTRFAVQEVLDVYDEHND